MKKYDIVIVGGGTSGCACAYIAAKSGLKTLLIEKENYLGGTMTGSLVVPVMKSGENQINIDFYLDLIKAMKEVKGQITYLGNPGWFDPIKLKDVLFNMLINSGVDIKLSSNVLEIKTKNSEILSVYYEPIYTDNCFQSIDMLSECIEANYFVDATANLNFSKKINCRILKNENDFPPISLRFIMSGVDYEQFGEWLAIYDGNRDVTTVENIDNAFYFSTAYTWDTDKHWALTPLFDKAVEQGTLKEPDRNYFQIFSVAGSPDMVAFNCPRLLDKIDLTDENALKSAYSKGEEIINRLAEFCREFFPGFENAYVSHIADKLGIRASDRIKGKYVYTIDDLKSGKKFEHPAVISSYPVDIHSRDKNSSTLEQTGEYQLPLESLMSADYDNLFVIGRSLSADEYAQGALRVQSSCFSMGEAVAKYVAAKLH